MTFFDAKDKYLDRVGDDYHEPDRWKSKRHGKLWKLRDQNGRPLAIVGPDGRVLASGTSLTARSA